MVPQCEGGTPVLGDRRLAVASRPAPGVFLGDGRFCPGGGFFERGIVGCHEALIAPGCIWLQSQPTLVRQYRSAHPEAPCLLTPGAGKSVVSNSAPTRRDAPRRALTRRHYPPGMAERVHILDERDRRLEVRGNYRVRVTAGHPVCFGIYIDSATKCHTPLVPTRLWSGARPSD